LDHRIEGLLDSGLRRSRLLLNWSLLLLDFTKKIYLIWPLWNWTEGLRSYDVGLRHPILWVNPPLLLVSLWDEVVVYSIPPVELFDGVFCIVIICRGLFGSWLLSQMETTSSVRYVDGRSRTSRAT
jgi:hypothetical protein